MKLHSNSLWLQFLYNPNSIQIYKLNTIFTNIIQTNSINLGWLMIFIWNLITVCYVNMVSTSWVSWYLGIFFLCICTTAMWWLNPATTFLYFNFHLSWTLWSLLVSFGGTKYTSICLSQPLPFLISPWQWKWHIRAPVHCKYRWKLRHWNCHKVII